MTSLYKIIQLLTFSKFFNFIYLTSKLSILSNHAKPFKVVALH